MKDRRSVSLVACREQMWPVHDGGDSGNNQCRAAVPDLSMSFTATPCMLHYDLTRACMRTGTVLDSVTHRAEIFTLC